MALGRRRAKRREPIFDATPAPQLRVDPRDRPAVPADDAEARPPAPGARHDRRAANDPGGPRKRAADSTAPGRRRRAASRHNAGSGRGGGGGWGRRLRRLAYWSVVLGLWGLIVAAGVIGWAAARLPPIQSLEVPQRPPSIQIRGEDGRLLATRGDMAGVAVPLEQLPPYLPQAFLAIEDRRFFEHGGLDPIAIARAALANILRRAVAQGGSTLTQQLAKNLFLTQERTFDRKIQEVILALWLERKFTKKQILELYLNRTYFGAGAYGVEAAAQRYFGKSARQVTLAEAALLAGLVKSPSRLAPTRNRDGAQRRAHLVLAAMVEAGFLDDRSARRAMAQAPRIVEQGAAGAVNYVADWVMDALDDLIGRVERDIVVDTTIDPALQHAAEKALAEELAEKGERAGIGQGAIVALSPHGAVRALVGGRNYAESQFNRAIAARRQPGSAFKPFVYLAALERGLAPDSVRDDRPIDVNGWRPENYSREYHGPVTLTQALALSLNTVAVRLALEVGPRAVVRTAHRLGIASRLEPNPSIALGTSEVSVLELVSAFAPFANGGIAIVPYVVERVREVEGRTLYRRKPPSLGRVIDARHVAMMNAMMRETLLAGTGRKADLAGWPAAGKTGTSQDFRDAWFIGYTAHLVAGVWLGNDDNAPSRRTTGGGLPAEIWSRFMKAAHRGVPVAALTELREGGAAAPVPMPRPPGTLTGSGRQEVPQEMTLDRWIIDRLFGRR